MPDASNEKLFVHVNVHISAETLQAIVANAKLIADKDAEGICRVDPADQLSIMISRFLDEMDFDNYVLKLENYSPQHK
jgi:hypothetical protein